ncbi:MAG: heme-binding protein [Planctomycetota bacterium]
MANWKWLAVAVVLGGAGIVWAANDVGERMPLREDVEAMLADLPGAADFAVQSPVREAIEAGREEEAREMLRFRPLAEAPVPEGFPPYTPVGVIEVKQYPAYRKAVGPSFWPLFQHIQAESIPMTAPVEMTGANRQADGDQPMAFLYQNTGVGQVGPAGDVAVEDNTESTAVSLGVRGRMSSAVVKDARQRLEAWLADHPEYQAASDEPLRLFGYNSPMVPDDQKYWEAQLLIEPVAGE